MRGVAAPRIFSGLTVCQLGRRVGAGPYLRHPIAFAGFLEGQELAFHRVPQVQVH